MSNIDPVERAKAATPPYVPSSAGTEWHTIEAQPTAWKSLPGAVRFVVWLYTILAIIGFVIGAVSLLVMLIGGGFALSQL